MFCSWTWCLAVWLEPPSGLHWFRLAALRATSGDSAADYDLCALLLSDNAILGSRDVVP